MVTRRIHLSFIPPFLPDQTLYSWVTMFHEMSGNVSEEATLLQIFGSEKAGRKFHVPSHLDAFCASTQRTLGDPEQLFSTATILPAYLRFRSKTVAAEVFQCVCGNQTTDITQKIRLSHSRLHTIAPRRVCHLCAENDLSNHGLAYWHRIHQLPGSLVCNLHGTTLYSVPMNSHGNRRGNFFTPTQDLSRLSAESILCHYSDEEYFILNRLALLAAQIATQPLAGGFSKSVMHQTCIAALRARDLFSDNVTKCLFDVTRDFSNHFRKVAWIPDLACVLTQRPIKPLGEILYNFPYIDHPLEYLMLIDWLFGNWEKFAFQYMNNCPE